MAGPGENYRAAARKAADLWSRLKAR